MKEILKTVIKDWQKTFPRAAVWERNLQVPFDSQKIISLIGPRRCGKTYYLHLVREEQAICYLKNKYECDFIVSENSIVTQALQVCLTLQDEATRQREMRGLLHAAERFNLPEAHIITLDEENEISIDDRKIFVYPAWKWLLTRL